jgi:thiol-disulfide isomerase/thioredoxin
MARVPTRRRTLRWLGLGLLGGLAGPLPAREGEVLPGVDVADWPAGRPTPPLRLPDLAGAMVDLAALRGKVVLVNFWASWCAPCRVEMPLLQEVPTWLGEDRVAVLAVNVKEAPRTVARFIAGQGWRVPVVLDAAGETARAWGVTVYPMTFLVDAEGQVRAVIRGEADWSQPAALGWVERLLPS